jgi:hypothetical protein
MVRPVMPSEQPLPFTTRLWFAWVCFFKVLFDGLFAARVLTAEKTPLELAPAPPAPPEKKKTEVRPKADRQPEGPMKAEVENGKPAGPPEADAALQLLALLQREGRFVDFLEEDVASFSDADIGAAARVVHQGCRKALREHVKLEPVRAEDEGAKVTLDGTPNEGVKLTGNVQGKGPHTGTLKHKGWKATDVKLPTAVAGHDTRIVAEAEVEL